MKRLFILILLIGYCNLSAEDFDHTSGKIHKNLGESLKELSQIRQDIIEEQVSLSREINRLEAEVATHIRQLERLQRQTDNRVISIDALRHEVTSRNNEIDYISGLLNEFLRNFESSIHISENQQYQDVIREAKLSLEDINLDAVEKFASQLNVVSLAIKRIQNIQGGERYEGKALTEDGVLERGTFVAIGPTVFFQSAESDTLGLSLLEVNSADSIVAHLAPSFSEGIKRLIAEGEGTFPADASLGNALKMERARDSMREHIAKGGFAGFIIISLGFLALIVSVFKLVDIGSVKIPSPDTIQNILEDIRGNNPNTASEKADTIPGLPGKVFQDALKNLNQRRTILEEIIFARILEIRPRLERFLAFLALVATAAPLLGLLGTVTGMIKTFNLITLFGTGDPRKLSGGISEALVTTELGLLVAIPILIIHGLLSRMSKRKMADLEQGAINFLNGLETRQES